MRGSEFAELTAFMAVARERSFRRASTRLGLSPSALSHTIRALEARIGARLLNRTTRSVAPTEAGRALYERLGPAIVEIESAVGDAGAFRSRPAGTVRLNLPRLAASLAIVPMMQRFAKAYPDVNLDLVVDDGFADVIAKGFDGGIRVGERIDRDMVALRLTAEMKLAVVGSPSYLAGREAPQVPGDLSHHACLNYRWSATGALYRWQFEGPEGPFDMEVRGPLTVNDTGLLLEAALAGAGLICLPEAAVRHDLAAGRLVRVLDDWSRPTSGMFLYYPARPNLPGAFRALVDFLKSDADRPGRSSGEG